MLRKIVFLLVSVVAIHLSFQATAQIDFPVDLITGKPVVSLPIVTVAHGTVAADVGIGYQGDGYRVGDTEGNAGMFWSLFGASPGISRDVKGLPDDLDRAGDVRKGWLYGTQAAGVNNFTPSADISCSDWNTLNGLVVNKDTEPDIWTVNAPGLGFSFVFDQNKNIRLLHQQNVKITYTRDASTQNIESFTVTNDRGITYNFYSAGLVTRLATKYKNSSITHFTRDYIYYSTALSFVQHWTLASITGPDGSSINYTYADEEGESSSYRYAQKVNASQTGIDTLYYISDKSRGKVLTLMSTPWETVNFTWTNGLISNIKVNKQNSGHVREFEFVYTEIRNTAESAYSGSTEIRTWGRNFLTEVRQLTDCQPLPSFRFEYYGIDLGTKTTSLPFKNNYPQDLFGYFNNYTVANVNTALVPLIYENASATNGERFRIAPMSGWTAIGTSASRNVNTSTVHYGALRRIQWPSGGYAEATYQAADYYDSFTASTLTGGGLRVASVTLATGSANEVPVVRNYEYKQANGASSGKWVRRPTFAFTDGSGVIVSPVNLSDEDQLLYERVSVINPGSGKTVYTYHLPAMYNVTSYNSNEWLATKTKVARYQEPQSPFYCEPAGNVVSEYYAYPFAPNTNYDFERGLLKQVEEYNQTGQILTARKNNYQRVGTAVRIKGIRHEQHQGLNYAYGKYELLAGLANVVSSDTTLVYDSADQTKKIKTYTSYTYNSKGYPKEEVRTNSDATTYTSGQKYASDYTVTTASDMQAGMLKKLVRQNMLAAPVESYSKVNTNITHASLWLYDSVAVSYPHVRYKLAYSGTGAFTLSAVAGSPQTFTYESAKYKIAETVEEYQSGLPVTTTDYKKNVSSALYGLGNVPAVSLSGARVKETVFADFEHASSTMIGNSEPTVADAWSGQKALQWNGAALTKNGVAKGAGRYYRFSCWVKATTSQNITVTAKVYNGTAWVSYPVTYAAASSGQWQLLNTRVDMNGIPDPFNFQLSSDAAVYLDDVSFHPEFADYARGTYDLMLGKTSGANTRNQYTFTDYDEFGRVKYERNTDKHILTAYDYRYQVEHTPKPSAAYSCTAGCELRAGTPITYTAPASCAGPVTYTWKVNGTVVGTAATLTYTFPTGGYYNFEFVMTSVTYGSAISSGTLWVRPAQPVLTLGVNNAGNILQCNDTGERTFNAAVTNACNVTYEWYYALAADGVWVRDLGGTTPPHLNSYTFSFQRLSLGWQAFSVKCVVVNSCAGPVPGVTDDTALTSEAIYIGFTPNPNCQ